ncbi:hypothetical protein V8E36_009863 [Tilletia maclaganii]
MPSCSDFRLVRGGNRQLAACRLCIGIGPMKMAKIAAHRSSAGHQHVAPMRAPRILPSPLPSPLSSRSPSPLHFGGDDLDAGVIDGLMHDAEAPPPIPRGPVRPRQGPGAVSEALRMHGRDRPAARMWSMDRDAQASSESDGDSADDMQEADRVNLTATEHEDWWPFNSQMGSRSLERRTADELYGLGLFETPRHPMSVKTQKMAIGFANGAVRAQGGRRRHEGVPSQKAFTTLKAELHRELGVTPIREVKGASGNLFFNASIKDALRRVSTVNSLCSLHFAAGRKLVTTGKGDCGGRFSQQGCRYSLAVAMRSDCLLLCGVIDCCYAEWSRQSGQ